MSGVLFSSSIFLGIWANELSEAEAVRKWERSHLPSEQIFGFAMGSRRLLFVSDDKRVQKLIHSISTHLDEAGSVWLSSDSNWVAFYSHPDQMIQVRFYCLDCTQIPHQWQPLGVGWFALEKVIAALDQKKAKAVPLPSQKRKVMLRDPREVVY